MRSGAFVQGIDQALGRAPGRTPQASITRQNSDHDLARQLPGRQQTGWRLQPSDDGRSSKQWLRSATHSAASRVVTFRKPITRPPHVVYDIECSCLLCQILPMSSRAYTIGGSQQEAEVARCQCVTQPELRLVIWKRVNNLQQ